MNVLRCELGKVASYNVLLENPSDKEVRAVARISNPTNFDVTPEVIILKPLSKTPVSIRYMPSNLEVREGVLSQGES